MIIVTLKEKFLIVLTTIMVIVVAVAGTFVTKAEAQSPRAAWAYYYSFLQYQIIGPPGQYVDYFYRAITNIDWPGTLYIETRIVGPNRFNTGWRLYGISLDNTVYPFVQEDRFMPKGTYCAQYELYSRPVTQKCFAVE